MPEEAPAWFRDALAAPVRHGVVDVDGCSITHRSWGRPGAPGLVLVHGGTAHAAWWDHVGPLFADAHHVVAPDLSGHGDSGRRSSYDMATWADEILAVATALGLDKPVVVGHSLGGWVTCAVGATHGDRCDGLVLVDSPLELTPTEQHRRRIDAISALPTYATADLALANFRLLPEQSRALPFVFEHVARTSVCEVDGRWAWKFDPRIFMSVLEFDPGAQLADVTCRFAAFRSEHGIVGTDLARQVRHHLGRDAPVVTLADAEHSVMVDQPLALVSALRTLLATW